MFVQKITKKCRFCPHNVCYSNNHIIVEFSSEVLQLEVCLVRLCSKIPMSLN